jgi:MraZ protein
VGKLGKPYFRGQSIHRLDSKGRLRIPTKFRDVLQNHYTDALIVTLMEECLVAYPLEMWEKIENKVLGFSQIEPQQRAFMRYFISSAEECEFDSQGRILIPPFLRERAGLGQEVLLAGVLTHFEIWDKANWDMCLDQNKGQYHEILQHVAAGTGL